MLGVEKKRGQHYVWRYYLSSWTNDNEKLFFLRNNEIRSANPKKVGKKRDFYRLKELSFQELAIIEKGFINEGWNGELQQVNRNWIILFTQAFKNKKKLEEQGRWNAELELKFDVSLNNTIEEFHSLVEDANVSRLNSLKSGDVDKVQNEKDKSAFLFFLSLQYCRTDMMRNNIHRSFANGPIPVPPTFIENIWSVLYFVIATNITYSLLSDKGYRILMLENSSTIPLITGDQPVINTQADYSNTEGETSELEFYYPISPSRAILISKSNQYSRTEIKFEIGEKEVKLYNDLIFKAAEEQLYGSNSTVLKDYIE